MNKKARPVWKHAGFSFIVGPMESSEFRMIGKNPSLLERLPEECANTRFPGGPEVCLVFGLFSGCLA